MYILEAHPRDGWIHNRNQRDGILFDQPTSLEARARVAGECMKDLGLGIPCLVDEMWNPAQRAYAGWPDRLYVIDKDGKVAFRGGLGPGGFKPALAEAVLKELLQIDSG